MMNNYSTIKSLRETTLEARDMMLKMSQNEGGLLGIPTGFHKIDEITCGFQAGNLITLGGVTSIGKTTFLLSLLRNIAVETKEPCLLLSAEMTNPEISRKLIANHCEIPHSKIVGGRLSDEEWKRFDKRIEELMSAPLFIEDTHQLYIDDIIREVKKAVKEKKVRLVAIDYLQMIYYRDKMNESRYVEINSIICKLKSLAMECQIPIIVVSQLNRKIDSRNKDDWGKIPQLSDLRDSGSIADDSDILMLMHRPEYFRIYLDEEGNDLRGMAQIIFAKQRCGSTGNVILGYKAEFCKVYNPEEVADDTAEETESRASSFNDPIGSIVNDMPF